MTRLRLGHQRPVNRGCPIGVRTPAIYCSLVSKPVSQDIQSICYCLHTGTFRLDTRDLLVAGVPISISSKYLYLYLELSGSTSTYPTGMLLAQVCFLFSAKICLRNSNINRPYVLMLLQAGQGGEAPGGVE